VLFNTLIELQPKDTASDMKKGEIKSANEIT